MAGTSTYTGQTFLSLGLTPGVYEWTWGNTNKDSYTLMIGNSNPVPGPLPILGTAAAFDVSRKLRNRAKRR